MEGKEGNERKVDKPSLLSKPIQANEEIKASRHTTVHKKNKNQINKPISNMRIHLWQTESFPSFLHVFIKCIFNMYYIYPRSISRSSDTDIKSKLFMLFISNMALNSKFNNF